MTKKGVIWFGCRHLGCRFFKPNKKTNAYTFG